MKHVIPINEIVGQPESMGGEWEVCTTAEADYDTDASRLQVTLDSFIRRPGAESDSERLPADWLPHPEMVIESVSRGEATPAIQINRSSSCLPSVALLGALLCLAPLLAPAQSSSAKSKEEDVLPKSEVRQLEEEVEQTSTVSAAYLREQIEALDKKEPLYVKTHACFFRLLDAGWSPTLLNQCLDALGDDAIIVGMPTDLVIAYFGGPRSREAIEFHGKPAEQWSIENKPGRIENVVVAGGKVVQLLEGSGLK